MIRFEEISYPIKLKQINLNILNTQKTYFLKLLLLIVMLVAFTKSGFAQAKFGGQIFENHTKIPLGGVVIENLSSHEKAVSDANGMFIIGAKLKDLLLFSAPAYASDTVYIANLNYLKVFLDLSNRNLNEVNVTGQELKTGKLSPMVETGPLGSRTVLYQVDAEGNWRGKIYVE